MVMGVLVVCSAVSAHPATGGNCRTIEGLRLEGDFIIFVPSPSHGQACYPLNQAAQSPIYSGLECLQGWSKARKSAPSLCLKSDVSFL